MKTKEEIFRIKGWEVAKFLIKKYSCDTKNSTLIEMKSIYLNKTELQELINWLISKLDEME